MRLAPVAALGVLVFVAAGCGGKRLSQSQFEAKTNAICARYTARAERELPQLNPSSPNESATGLARFGRVIERVESLFGRQLDELRRVQPPPESAPEYRQVLRLYAQIQNALARAGRAARKGDRAGLARIQREFGQLGARVDALGFECD
jgi:hypothetical protein